MYIKNRVNCYSSHIYIYIYIYYDCCIFILVVFVSCDAPWVMNDLVAYGGFDTPKNEKIPSELVISNHLDSELTELIFWSTPRLKRFVYMYVHYKCGMHGDSTCIAYMSRLHNTSIIISECNSFHTCVTHHSKHAITCLNWARTGPMLTASARF